MYFDVSFLVSVIAWRFSLVVEKFPHQLLITRLNPVDLRFLSTAQTLSTNEITENLCDALMSAERSGSTMHESDENMNLHYYVRL